MAVCKISADNKIWVLTKCCLCSIVLIVRAVSAGQSYARVAQLVERDLAKVEAAGSSPVSRSLEKSGNADKIGVPVLLFIFMILME